MSRFVLFLLPSISLTPRVRTPGHCSKKNNGLIFLPQRQARQRQDSMTVKQVQRRRNRFNAIQADSKTTKHIPRHPSTFDRDSKRIPRRRRGWIPQRRRGFNEFEADITTTTQIPQQRYEFHDNDTDGHLSDQYGRRPVLLLGPLGLTIAMFSFGMSTTFWPLVISRCFQGVFNGNIGVYPRPFVMIFPYSISPGVSKSVIAEVCYPVFSSFLQLA